MGFVVVSSFVLNYFGYAINMDYFSMSKAACQEKLKECAGNTVRQGVENVKCDINCIDPKLIIKKK